MSIRMAWADRHLQINQLIKEEHQAMSQQRKPLGKQVAFFFFLSQVDISFLKSASGQFFNSQCRLIASSSSPLAQQLRIWLCHCCGTGGSCGMGSDVWPGNFCRHGKKKPKPKTKQVQTSLLEQQEAIFMQRLTKPKLSFYKFSSGNGHE